MKPEKIFLIGMPGSGKTTLGEKLASHLRLPFLDLDQIIIQKEGQEIADIFQTKGEAYFRKVEHQCLTDVIYSNEKFILATGGGTPCFYDNISRINKSGISIFIDIPVQEIITRLQDQEVDKRPLISKMAQEDFSTNLKSHYQNRIQYYTQAHITIKGDETPDSISRILSDFNPRS